SPGEAACFVWIGPTFGVPRNIIIRHERGHCNGWPGTHEGVRRTGLEWEAETAPTKVTQSVEIPVDTGEPPPPPPRRPRRPVPVRPHAAPPPGVLIEPWTRRPIPCLPTILTLALVQACI